VVEPETIVVGNPIAEILLKLKRNGNFSIDLVMLENRITGNIVKTDDGVRMMRERKELIVNERRKRENLWEEELDMNHSKKDHNFVIIEYLRSSLRII
jgi:hypothetical protein